MGAVIKPATYKNIKWHSPNSSKITLREEHLESFLAVHTDLPKLFECDFQNNGAGAEELKSKC